MQKSSFLFLLLILGVVLIGVYQSMFQLSSQTSFNRFFALSSFFLLCISLIIGPIVAIWPKEYAQLIEPRRAVGIVAFVFVIVHIFLVLSPGWMLLPVLNANIIAVPATLILLILTITSSDFAVKSLGPVWWKHVQRFNYLAFVLSFVHFILRANGLFVQTGNGIFVNLAEIVLIFLGIATVGLQIAGFVVRKNRSGPAQN